MPSLSVRVIRDATAVLGDDVGGSAVDVEVRAGYELSPARVIWLYGGRVLLEMHHSLTLSLDAKDVEVVR